MPFRQHLLPGTIADMRFTAKQLLLTAALAFALTPLTELLWLWVPPFGVIDGYMLNTLNENLLIPAATIGEWIGFISLVLAVVRWNK